MTSIEKFGQRKKDHIEISLRQQSQATLDQFEKYSIATSGFA